MLGGLQEGVEAAQDYDILVLATDVQIAQGIISCPPDQAHYLVCCAESTGLEAFLVLSESCSGKGAKYRPKYKFTAALYIYECTWSATVIGEARLSGLPQLQVPWDRGAGGLSSFRSVVFSVYDATVHKILCIMRKSRGRGCHKLLILVGVRGFKPSL